MVAILMMWTKLTTVGLVKIKVFWNKCYVVIITVHELTNKILSCDSNYTVDALMWPKFSNSSISMRKVTITSILWGFDQKNNILEGCSWFKFNNLGLALGVALKFYRNVIKGLKLRVRKFKRLIPTFVKVTGEIVRGFNCAGVSFLIKFQASGLQLY